MKTVFGVMKAYTTRVGVGAFPTELKNVIYMCIIIIMYSIPTLPSFFCLSVFISVFTTIIYHLSIFAFFSNVQYALMIVLVHVHVCTLRAGC